MNIEKFTDDSVSGLLAHNNRLETNSDNPDIDVERTPLNYSLTPETGIGIEEYRESKSARAVIKDKVYYMRPIRTDCSNIIYVADGYGDLPATLFEGRNGNYEVETVWELTGEEVEQIVKGKRFYLYIMGTSVPPLLLTSESLRSSML